MRWRVDSLARLIALSLACGCAAQGRGAADPAPDQVAPPLRTHPQGRISATLHDGRRPFGIAISRDGVVYCTLLDAGRLARSTLGADSLTTHPVGQVPTDVAFSPSGTWAYVTNQWGHTLGVVDARTSQQVAAIGLSGDPYRVAVGPEGEVIYVTTNAGDLVLIDPGLRRVTGTVHLGGNLNGLVLNAAGSRVYVGDVAGRIYELDAGGDVLREFPMPGRPQGLGLSDDGRELYAAGEDGDLIVLDLETGTEAARVPLGAGGFGLAITPDQAQIWITAPAAGLVFVLDRAARSIDSTLEIDGMPRRLAFDRSGALAAIADEAGSIRFVR